MNLFKKIYCRTFQFCLKVALPLLPYKDPKIISSVKEINKVLIDEKCINPIIITDKSLLSLGLCNDLFNHLDESNINYSSFSNVVANPTTDNVLDALEIYKKNNCDSIIALGGGSVIDCAKSLGALIARPKKSLNKMAGILKVMKKIPTLIAIPTTAGTGSETTLASVIVDSKTRHKYAINDFPLIPKYAVLDEELIMNLPKSITSTTGMDALTHAIESYIGLSGNKGTRKDALMAIKLIFNNLEISYFENTRESRKNMLYASHLAGRSFSKAYVGNVHAIAHALGGKYNIAHGYANAVILPMVLEKYGDVINKKAYEILNYCDIKCDLSNSSKILIEKINDMNNKMNIINTIKINPNDIEELAKYAYKEANPLYPVPIMFSINDFKEFYKNLGVNND